MSRAESRTHASARNTVTRAECATWRDQAALDVYRATIADGVDWSLRTVRKHICGDCGHDDELADAIPAPSIPLTSDENGDDLSRVRAVIDRRLDRNHGDTVFIAAHDNHFDDVPGREVGRIVRVLADRDNGLAIERVNPDAHKPRWQVQREVRR